MRTHEIEIRVRYQETDNMGVVYYANYLVWFEISRTEYLRALGLSYRAIEEKGYYLMVASARCDYLAPAKYDDIVKIETRISYVKHSSLKFEYKLSVEGKTVATGESVHVFTNRSCHPVRVPKEIKELFTSSK